MKNYILTFLLLGTFLQAYTQQYTNKKGQTHLWGHTSIDALSSGDYATWFEKQSKDYKTELTPDQAINLKDVEVKIFLGTWCGDTKYLVPKFIKTWTDLGLDKDQLELIALHNEGDKYKQGPNKETEGLNIHRVPTFIFSKDDKEIGRIVERTIFDLDTDMMLIAEGHPYEERYQAATLLDKYFDEFSGDTLLLQENFMDAVKLVRRELASSGDLNALGYVLMAQGKTEKAEFTFRLNKYMHKYNPNIIDSYAEFLFDQERYEDSLDQYLEVLRIKGEDRHASKMIADIYLKMEDEKNRLANDN